MIYHANYLKYAERVRSLWLRRYLHSDALNWLADRKWAFVVVSLAIDYHRPGRLGDRVIADFWPKAVRHADLTACQIVARAPQEQDQTTKSAEPDTSDLRHDISKNNILASMSVRLALIDIQRGRPMSLKKNLPDLIDQLGKIL